MKIFGFAVVIAGIWIFSQACSTLTPKEASDASKIERRLAEMNDRIDALSHHLSALQFMVEDHEKTLAGLEKPVSPGDPKLPAFSERTADSARPGGGKTAEAASSDKPPALVPASAEAAYSNAFSVYQAKDYPKAAAMFDAIAENYPGHDLADNALYWSGECRYAQKDYPGAIAAFKKVIGDYPKEAKVPDALLKIGYAYSALGDRVNAQSFLKKVVKEYPFTPAATKAGDMLKKMQPP